MADFSRRVSHDLISNLKNEPLFLQKLKQDIGKLTPAVFPAFRDNCISFYYRGGGLFKYENNNFSTNIKYAIVPTKFDNSYVTEDDLKTVCIQPSFEAAYEPIKERCKIYGTIEADGVSNLYSYSGTTNEPIILLDTEIALYDTDDKSRIDLLFYNIRKRELCFCEAKHFSNPEIWSNKTPKVCKQIDRYNKKIAKFKNKIIDEYKICIEQFNYLFDTNIPKPEKLCDKVGLLIFGYDKLQSEKISELLIKNGNLNDIPFYTKGNIKEIKSNNIAKLYSRISKG